MKRASLGVAALAVLSLSGASCALTSKSDSVFFRYFTPERPAAPNATSATDDPNLRKLQLRLGRVSSSSYIKDAIAFRDSDYEIGFYEQLRWAERPEAYLRRAMSRALFEGHGIQQIVGGPGPTLEIELDVFEELRAPRHAARVQVSWMLRDDQLVMVQRTLRVEHPIATVSADAQASAVATAMADALGEAIDTMVAGIVTELSRATPRKT